VLCNMGVEDKMNIKNVLCTDRGRGGNIGGDVTNNDQTHRQFIIRYKLR
jgi:hypothetical protein